MGLKLSALTLGCLGMTAALAQVSAPEQAPLPSPLPQITITASRLPRIDTEGVQPLHTLTRADIERSGAASTVELLQQLPWMQGGTMEASGVGPATYGYAGASVHGVGDTYTVVLLNGQRLPSFGGQSPTGFAAGVDLSTLPLSAIERIEVLPGGASAIHGADAIGGVINVITRRTGRFNEGRIDLHQPAGGAREWQLSAATGVGDLATSGHNLTLSASTSHREALVGRERRFANRSVIDFGQDGQRYRFAANSLVNVPNTAPANVLQDDGSLINPILATTGQCPAGLRISGQACSYDYAGDVDLLPERKRESLLASYTLQAPAGWQIQADALLARTRTQVQTTAVPALLTVWSDLPVYSTYLAPLGFSADPFTYARLSDLGPRTSEDTATLSHLGLRASGSLGAWQVNTGWHASRSRVHSRVANTTSLGAIQQTLLESDLYDPFVGPGQQTAAAAAALQGINYRGSWTQGLSLLDGLSVDAARELTQLPGGPLKLGVGAALMWERWQTTPSAFAQGLLLDPAAGTMASDEERFYGYALRLDNTQALQAARASRRVWSAFTEVSAPVTPTWTLSGALRHDRFEGSAHAVSGQVGSLWRAAPQWLVRTSLGTGFKAPTLAQLYSPLQDYGRSQVAHDCSQLQALYDQLGAPCPGSDVVSRIAQTASGNQALQPERSQHATLGVRFEPSPAFSLGVDAWLTTLRGGIGEVNAAQLLADPARWASRTRLRTMPDGTQEVVFQVSGQNQGKSLSSGVDLDLNAAHDTPWGRLSHKALLSVTLREISQAAPGSPYTSALADASEGTPVLRWKGRWQGHLRQGSWGHTLTLNVQSGWREAPREVSVLDAQGQDTGQTASVRLKVPHHLTLDWQSSWQAPVSDWLGGRWQLTAGVLNVLDQAPPLSLALPGSGKAFQVGYDERFFDARGRTWVVGLQSRF